VRSVAAGEPLMPVCECLSAFVLGVAQHQADALFLLAVNHTSDHSRRLLDALEAANRKAWRSLEIALAGESLWTWFDREETKALRREIQAFIATVEFPELAGKAEYRARCLRDLREATGAVYGLAGQFGELDGGDERL